MAHAPDGTQRLTLRLDPPELGHVQIRIDRPPDAPARVEITVEKPETLTLLLRDQPQLQRALDQAGVPPDGRSVTFHIATAEAGTALRGRIGTRRYRHGLVWRWRCVIRCIPSGRPAGARRICRRRRYETPILHCPSPPEWVRAGLDITA